MSAPACITPFDVAEAQLDAYNAQDLEAYCSFFTDDLIVADLNGAVTISGIDAFRAKYAQVFADFPENKVELLGRMTIGNTVIDHELVIRKPGGDQFEVAAIYTIADAKIVRIDFVK
ncbi:nuclear transport factor 2 family protein [Phenylobacterium sp.]|uniref:nuclear transport factor 2 family protein n=1 Tax=Phenylobacterium sp. TaxID=1871053 RepID=UPI00272681D5|nr:nuclear transport factor 2 family protein [Phenylobacterium sp.]MDO8379659.1 nuclear transport factor 2 family protein [Phenylobacterium sp.]